LRDFVPQVVADLGLGENLGGLRSCSRPTPKNTRELAAPGRSSLM
jgi:hypothetical protein